MNEEPLSRKDSACVGLPRPLQDHFKGFNYFLHRNNTSTTKHENKLSSSSSPPDGGGHGQDNDFDEYDEDEQNLQESLNTGRSTERDSLYPPAVGASSNHPRSLLGDAEGSPGDQHAGSESDVAKYVVNSTHHHPFMHVMSPVSLAFDA